MQEEKVIFYSGDLSLEGLCYSQPGDKGSVIAHPHPQMGGNMYNNVVDAMVQAFIDNGFSTLRFNFRSVGHSHGCYDNGRGEVEDALAARHYLSTKENNYILLAGYSFGAVVMMDVYSRLESSPGIIMVSPPFNIEKLKFSRNKKGSGLVICGDQDQFCNADNLQKWTGDNDFQFKIVNGADHFYMGVENVIIKHIEDFLSNERIK